MPLLYILYSPNKILATNIEKFIFIKHFLCLPFTYHIPLIKKYKISPRKIEKFIFNGTNIFNTISIHIIFS